MTATPTDTGPRASGYFAAGANFEVERKRLELLEEHDDPGTFERLRATGVCPGWRCLEVGAGAGSVARWLAEQVGSDGLVVATDIDTRFLGHLRGPVEIRQHDILTDPVEPGAYDLVHCRSLLTHLSDPDAALARMAEALRPGGWLVAENHDYSSFTAVDRGEPRADQWDRAVATVLSVAETHGLFVPDFGRRLVALIREADLVIVAQEGRTSVRCGGDVVARFAQHSCAYLAGLVEFAGGGAEMEIVLAGLDDPAFEFVAATTFGVTARRADTETCDARRG
jgi:2-polyprenyl-3-methyl-5-hydroxy-6-metoxy-1,4-benzoquinol methylase